MFYVFISAQCKKNKPQMLPAFFWFANCCFFVFVYSVHNTCCYLFGGDAVAVCYNVCHFSLSTHKLPAKTFKKTTTKHRARWVNRSTGKEKKNAGDHSLWTVIGFILLLRKWLGCSNFNFIGHVHRVQPQCLFFFQSHAHQLSFTHSLACLLARSFFNRCSFTVGVLLFCFWSNRTWSAELMCAHKNERHE